MEVEKSWEKRNETPLTTPKVKADLHPKKVMPCLLRLERQCILRTPSACHIEFRLILFPTEMTEAVIDENGKASIMTTPVQTSIFRPDRNWYNLAGMPYCTHHAHQTLHIQIATYFDPYRMLLMRRTM